MMLKPVRNLVVATVGAVALGFAMNAAALTINVSGVSDPGSVPLSGTAVFSFTQNGTNSVFLDMVVTNNNTAATRSALGGVLLAFTPNLALLNPGGLGYDDDPDGDNIASVFEKAIFHNGGGGWTFDIDFCATAGSNCNGVGPSGLSEGQTDDGFRFILTFNSAFTAAALEQWMSGAATGKSFGLCMRWQAIDGFNSAGGAVTGASGKGCVMEIVPPDENVPEPGTLALLGLGLLGLGLSRRKMMR